MTQPNPWSTATALKPSTDSTFGGAKLDEKDVTAITEAVEAVRTARDKAKAENKDLRTLLYLGVGVGNPTGAWKNPSGSTKFDADALQVSPQLIKDAIAKGFFVIGLNFNVADTVRPAELPAASGIHVHVTAKFPLGDTGEPKGALLLLRTLAAESDRVVVLNAVSNHAYPGLVTLALVHSSNRTITAAGCVRSVYALSYAETNEQVVIAPSTHGHTAHARQTGLTSVAAVFPTVEELQEEDDEDD